MIKDSYVVVQKNNAIGFKGALNEKKLDTFKISKNFIHTAMLIKQNDLSLSVW